VDPAKWWNVLEVSNQFGACSLGPKFKEHVLGQRQGRLQLCPVSPPATDKRCQLIRVLGSAALPYLVKTNGRIINVSSGSAQVRIPTTSCVPPTSDHSVLWSSLLHSDYATSKFALGRFNEFISIGACPLPCQIRAKT
jgi:hypothetical protein